MRLLIFVELVALAIFLFIAFHVIVYRNPYKLYMVFGKKGSGKTTLMTKLAIQYQKKKVGMSIVIAIYRAVINLIPRILERFSSLKTL